MSLSTSPGLVTVGGGMGTVYGGTTGQNQDTGKVSMRMGRTPTELPTFQLFSEPIARPLHSNIGIEG